ncbi:telomerase protein component 1-like isoform 2-T2 [Clarias gariepinus]|uniref:telomerase protein component 1-like isoform X2 n=1 Tax=Clarias gariepinus TaxID=13013 RepID=UPI00234D045F|nr:telomerase protein component 1-like isoform X2 [Clarias gariepinus]
MREAAPLQPDPSPDMEAQHNSRCTGPSLENRILTQASPFLLQPPSWANLTLSCPALRPSSLSSTALSSSLLSTSSSLSSTASSSSLLSTSSSLSSTALSSPLLSTPSSLLSSSLLSTENTQLISNPITGSSFCSSQPLSLLVHSTAPPTGPEAHKCLSGKPGETKIEDDEVCSTDDLSSYSEELNESSAHEEQMESDGESPAEIPVLSLRLNEEEEKQTLELDEGFGEFDSGSNEAEELLKEKKYKLLNVVCCSLVHKSQSPGQVDWDKEGSVWSEIKLLGTDITLSDPEFLLKVAVYTRQELNIRVTANFLLALAAYLPNSKSHLRRYFCSAVRLPSDWLEVTRIYSTCFSRSLPSGLKKALADKFKQFSEYQLAKYNTCKHRCKHIKNKGKAMELSPEKWNEWAKLLAAEPRTLKGYLKLDQRQSVDKQQKEFNMKKLIKQLHIKEPAESVMSILGKKYPADVRAFWRSGLSGVWQSERANQRMKLKQPDTWETLLSQKGNSATTWEKLIDNNSLPFMAMLRNLRNMITKGISLKHHEMILKRLSSKSAVIQSRQFPFRFLSAYKVIMELNKLASAGVKEKNSKKEALRGVLKKMPKKINLRTDWSTATRQRLRTTLRIPFVRGLYYSKLKMHQKASPRCYTPELLQRYRQALDKAVEISCTYNIPPLSGHTLVLFGRWLTFHGKKGTEFCIPSESSAGSTEDTNLSASVLEVAVLLAMMICYCSERARFVLAGSDYLEEVHIKSDGLLENVRKVSKLLTEWEDLPSIEHNQFFNKLLEEKTKVDTIILVGDYSTDYITKVAIQRFRRLSTHQPLLVNILINQSKTLIRTEDDPESVTLCGFSEQILRFISERGSSRFLDHVEQIDKLYKIPPPTRSASKPERSSDIIPLPAVPKLRWRSVRVFISSTFRDMHGERDVLVRSVFPELRRRAASLCLHLQEVDLRWGVTEEESARAAEICLREVCRSHLLLGILGERYGLVPPRPSLPDLPHYSWLKSAPEGLSVTEMEIRQFQAVFPDSAQSRMFFYFRSPQLLSSVPEAWRDDFAAESQKNAAKMDELKKWIKSNDFGVMENYPCEWGGVIAGKAYVKALEDFAKAVMEDLWSVIQRLFVEESDEADLTAEIKEQEVHQEAQSQQFYGRAKLLSKAKEKIEESQRKGGVLLVQGGAGVGKTTFMASLAHSLQTPDKRKKVPMCDVISYSTAASHSASGVEPLLRCLVQWLRKRKEQEEELPPSTPYRDLLSELLSQLKEVKKGRSLALLIDGADLVHDAKGQRISEWIPQHIPKGVCLVLSVTTGSDLHNTISKSKSCTLFPLGPLLLPDRREIVEKELSVYGKKLSDSAFNNQLQTLLMKKGAASPLYLRLACEELRNYASFEKMKENLQCLPVSLCELIQHSLIRLNSQYEGTGLSWTLAALTVSSTGLKERDLYFLLNLCTDLSSTHTPLNWKEAIKHARNPKTMVPMATFSQLARNLQSLIGSSLSVEPDQSLVLTNPDFQSAFEQLYLSDPDDRTRAHMILAAYLWVQSDPHGHDTFLHCDPDTLAQLPAHLVKSRQWEPMHFLLCNYYFLYANVHHGLLRSLMENYVLYEKGNELNKPLCPEAFDGSDEVLACLSFLKRHAPLLCHWPTLFVQQALNEPDASAAHIWAKCAVEEGNVHAVRWMNKSQESRQESGELVSTFQWTPSCVSLSPTGRFMAVGTVYGSLHIYHTHTNQEVKSLISNCDGISGCVFLDDCVLWSTSYDGQVEAWDINSGCRTVHLTAHSNRITGFDVSSDRKHLSTVSLDFTLKVWSSRTGKQEASLENPCPLNCVNFDPEGSLVAVGCWDGAVRVWDWIKQENCMTLSGHQCSVRSVSFSPSSSLSLLCSGALDREMRLWSVPGASCVWRLHAHHSSTEALHFLGDGDSLLSAGHDGMVQLWSGGLGRSVSMLGEEKKLLKSSEARQEVVSEAAALCVAVNGHYVAVGYHGNGLKIYNGDSGSCVWSTEDLRVSMLCVLWLKTAADDLLLSGGLDQRLRLWRKRRGHKDTITLAGVFGVQKGAVLALNQNITYVASASDDFTIALWLKRDLTSDPWAEPRAVCVLRGHSGGVTCLAFSPKGDQLLSGGKDTALNVWNINSSPPSLSCALPHCHGDWITGCAWTPSAVMSCSNDCRLKLWDIQTGSCIREVSTASSVGSLCCWEDYVMLGSADGLLTVWKSNLGVIAEIKAHLSRIHHTTIIPKPGLVKNPEDVLIATASDDGSVKLWQPLQVEHRSTLLGHSGGVRALASGSGPHFLTVSDDRSLRAWSVNTGLPPRTMESVSAMCFLELQDVLVCAFSSGRLEMWQQLKLLYSNKLSDSRITALCSLPDERLAVGCTDTSVNVWKLERDSQQCITGLSKVHSYNLKSNALFLHYSTTLLAVRVGVNIVDIFPNARGKHRSTRSWDFHFDDHVLCIEGNGEDGMWLVVEKDDIPVLAYLHPRYKGKKGEQGRKRKRKGKQKRKEAEGGLLLEANVSLKSGIDQTQTEEGKKDHHHQEEEEEMQEGEEEQDHHHKDKDTEDESGKEQNHDHQEEEEMQEEEEEQEHHQKEEEEEMQEGEEEQDHHHKDKDTEDESGKEQNHDHQEEEEMHEEEEQNHHQEEGEERQEVEEEQDSRQVEEDHHPEEEDDHQEGEEMQEDEEEDEQDPHKEEEKRKNRKYRITAAALHEDLVVCGNSKGHMWFNETPTLSSWTPRRRVHSDRISVLRLTESIIISASYDRTIKLWDRKTKKQLGLFVCDAPVEVLQVNPNDPSQIVCGDALGQIYFLSWKG